MRRKKQNYWNLSLAMTILSAGLAALSFALILAKAGYLTLLTVAGVCCVFSIATAVGSVVFVANPVRRIASALEQLDARSMGAVHNAGDGKAPLKNSEPNYIEKKIRDLQSSIEARITPAAEEERQRKILMASICHDLRTPLTSINGYVEAIQDGVGDINEHLRTILEKAEFMNKLIDDLDVHSKNSLDKLVIYRKPTLAHELIRRCASGHGDPRIHVAEPVVKAYIYADAYRIMQILNNIVSNARKFASKRIDISTAVDNRYYIITVSDDGEGVPDNYRAAIFDPFFTSRKNSDSAGLGLSIAKSLAEAHDGSIELEASKADGTSHGITSGATFIIKIPLASAKKIIPTEESNEMSKLFV